MRSNADNRTSFKEVYLFGAKIKGELDMSGASFDGALTAGLLQVGGNLGMTSQESNKASFKGVDLTGAKVAGLVVMIGASFDGVLTAGLLQVGGNLFMGSLPKHKTSFKGVDLTSAKVAGFVDMRGASFEGALNASSLEVGGDLSMPSNADNRTSFKEVNLNGAKIKGELDMSGASFEGALNASSLEVGGDLSMRSNADNRTSFKEVNLNGAKIKGELDMSGASFEGALNASSLEVGGDLLMRDAHCADKVDMFFAHVGHDLDLRGASLGDLNLSGASIAAALQLGGVYESAAWKGKYGKFGALNLRHAHAGNLVDAKEGAWPAKGQLRLDGFTFGRLGGFEGDSGPETKKRKIALWDNWARLDPDYSPASYAQLATALTNSGDRDAANEIRYLGRQREREAACKETWLRGSCLLETALGSVAGYGIGAYTFKVLPWVLAFWLAGASLLWWTVPAAKNCGVIWCFCASLAQLLPVIPINKELSEFFNDPERTRLKGWQVFLFSALGVVGLALGTILLVAVSGLTRSS